MRRATALGLGSLALACALAGCSAIVGASPGEIYCIAPLPGEEDPCPGEQRCMAGVCRVFNCEPLPGELCNGVDDDCDLAVDEGLDVDGDGDRYVACNTDEPSLEDCDDGNPLVFPHEAGRDSRGDAPPDFEPCNGRDDDCNPSSTEADGCGGGEVCYRPPTETALACYPIADCRTTGGSICGSGTFCGPEGRCVAEMMGMECTPLTRDSRCQDGRYCNAEGLCVDTLTIGAPCTSAVECASDTCFPNAAFGLPGAGGFCGISCCSNSDCVDGFACLVPGTGARSCYPAGLVTGTPVCSHDEDCGGDRCRALAGGLGSRSQCQSPGIRQDPGGFCPMDNSWCGSGICFDYACAEVCQTSADCGDGAGCVYTSRSPTVPHCVNRDLGPGRTGESCGAGCRDGLCWNDVCADTCCNDDQCSVGRCIPVDNAGWEMRCVPISVAGSPG
jgi:hypothetical protein